MLKHPLLIRQLKLFNLNETTCPASIEQWSSFLARIDLAYSNFDENRYIVERSQNIATRELKRIYEDLENTEHIAHIGTWVDDLKNNKTRGSPEADRIIGVDRSKAPMHFEDFLAIVHPDDRDHFKEKMKFAIENKTDYEIEMRLVVNDSIRWVYVRGRPFYNETDPRIAEKLQGVMMDITERKLAEQKKEMEHKVIYTLMEEKPLSIILKKVLQIICETFNWKLGVFWRFEEGKQQLIRQEIWGGNDDTIKAYLESIPEEFLSPHSHFLMGKVIETNKPYWVDITKVDAPEYKNYFQHAEIQSAISFPVIGQDKTGTPPETLCFFSKDRANIDKLTLASINAVARHLGLFIEKKRIQEHEKTLNQELIVAARRAGMAEVATSVLHNVGNILNSINVSTTLLREKLEHSTLLTGFTEINRRLKEHAEDFNHYVAEDPQGKQLPKYLDLLESALIEQRTTIAHEIESLNSHVQHVKEVIVTQQSIGGTIGSVEPIFIPAQVEDAVAIVGFNTNYKIERYYQFEGSVNLDKVKLMQILVNLIRNAKDALMESKQENKKLTLIIKEESKHTLKIQIQDNGIGIEPEIMKRLFSFGFTTKTYGHGFGLHTSVSLAKELGGQLFAESEGHDKGATFTLELPLITLEKEEKS